MNTFAFLIVFILYLCIAKLVFVILNFIFGNNISLDPFTYFFCFTMALSAFGVLDK